MSCYAVRTTQINPGRGNSGSRPYCIATLPGSFSEAIMKQCTKCRETKPIKLFYKQHYRPDGYTYWCVDCLRAYNKLMRKKPSYIEKRRLRCRGNKKYIKTVMDWHKSHPEKIKEYAKKSREKRKDKIAINAKLASAVRSGDITRPNKCEECNKKCIPDGHHNDYSKPLDVQWLCRQCHKKKHWK